MNAPLAAVVVALAVACAIADIRTGLIPNTATYPSLAMLFCLACITHTFAPSLAGAAAASGSLLFLHALTRGRGMGLGDVKLAACIGAGLGVRRSAVALAAAFILGAGAGVVLLAARKAKFGDRIPFGPFLAAGSIAGLCLNEGFA
jgi:prepilin signal peptidase PulO-like enzyme (type II secretory pathway)